MSPGTNHAWRRATPPDDADQRMLMESHLSSLPSTVKTSRRLTLVYLANDVIQNSRKKGPEFTKEFSAALKPAFEFVAKSVFFLLSKDFLNLLLQV